jgi:hypothetical protein
MHLVGVRRALAERHPWLPAAVLKAFTEAKAVALARLADTTASKAMLPFVDAQLAAARDLMGEDYTGPMAWPPTPVRWRLFCTITAPRASHRASWPQPSCSIPRRTRS